MSASTPATAATAATLKIGELAERTGTNPPTIRYYEEIGLLPRAARQGGGQRRYGDDAVRRVTFVRRCRDFGFAIDQVRELVELSGDPGRDCAEARDIGRAHLAAIRERLAELRALEREMQDFVERCDTACAGGPGTACVPLVALGRAEAPAGIGGGTRRATARLAPRAPRASVR
jgi:DNA-binding transcriptional MerR regulator